MNNVMTLNAELYRQLGCIADDESAMKKVLKCVKRIVSKSEKEKTAAEKEKAYVIAQIEEGLKELEAIQQGKAKAIPAEEVHAELRRDGYYD